MKVVFAHDFPMIIKGNKVYSKGGFPYEIWKRYLTIFDEVVVVGRRSKELNIRIDNLSLSSGPSVKFTPLPNLSDPLFFFKKDKALNIIKQQLSYADVLIARLPSEVGLLAIDAAKSLKKPYLIEVVGCPYDALWYHGSPIGKIYAPISYLRNKRKIAESKYTIYVTKDYLQKKYPSSGITENISNVNISGCSEEILLNRLTRIESVNSFKIGLIANLNSKYKGLEYAIESVRILKNKGYTIKLHILGGGEPSYYKQVIEEKELSNYIFFDGTKKSGDEVNEWLDNIDIYIQPSLTEGLPRALIEALSRGCPSVATNVGGIPELLNENFLVNKKDSVSLASAIEKLILDKSEMAKAARTNFNNAKNYEVSYLMSKRKLFLEKFVSEVVQQINRKEVEKR